MQLYAFDEKKEIISSLQAKRHRNYQCLECGGPLRIRGGQHRQKHFFHLSLTSDCSQRRKSMTHIQVQCTIQRLLPQGDCHLERPFPEISRIADVVWESEKLIFEVQCSSMRAEEALARNQDYARVGYQVVWILHDKRYNRWRMTAVEEGLRHSPHYYTNIDSEGNGHIYDQWQWSGEGIRRDRLWPLTVDIRFPLRKNQESKKCALLLVEERQGWWPLFFEGDLLSIAYRQEDNDYFIKAMERQSLLMRKKENFSVLDQVVRRILRTYKILFNYIVERSCH